MESRVGIESTSEAREGWFRLLGSSSAKASADLRQSPTPPLRYEFRESWRARPTDSTGLMVGAHRPFLQSTDRGSTFRQSGVVAFALPSRFHQMLAISHLSMPPQFLRRFCVPGSETMDSNGQ